MKTQKFEFTAAGYGKAQEELEKLEEGQIIADSREPAIFLEPSCVNMIRNFETILMTKETGQIPRVENTLRILD